MRQNRETLRVSHLPAEDLWMREYIWSDLWGGCPRHGAHSANKIWVAFFWRDKTSEILSDYNDTISGCQWRNALISFISLCGQLGFCVISVNESFREMSSLRILGLGWEVEADSKNERLFLTHRTWRNALFAVNDPFAPFTDLAGRFDSKDVDFDHHGVLHLYIKLLIQVFRLN